MTISTLPAADTTAEFKETVIDDSQPPMDDFDLLVTQMSQVERAPQAITTAGTTHTPIEARKAYIKGKMLEEIAL